MTHLPQHFHNILFAHRLKPTILFLWTFVCRLYSSRLGPTWQMQLTVPCALFTLRQILSVCPHLVNFLSLNMSQSLLSFHTLDDTAYSISCEGLRNSLVGTRTTGITTRDRGLVLLTYKTMYDKMLYLCVTGSRIPKFLTYLQSPWASTRVYFSRAKSLWLW